MPDTKLVDYCRIVVLKSMRRSKKEIVSDARSIGEILC